MGCKFPASRYLILNHILQRSSPFPIQVRWYSPCCTCHILSKANRWKEEYMPERRNGKWKWHWNKNKAAKYNLGQLFMRLEVSTSKLCTYGIGFIFFLAQMSHRISAQGEIPARGLFLYRLINHFSSLPLPSFPGLSTSWNYSLYKICHSRHSERKSFQERK